MEGGPFVFERLVPSLISCNGHIIRLNLRHI